MPTREELLARTMVELTDNLVDKFDVIDILTLLADRCVEIFDVTTAGIMLVNGGGELKVVASSSEEMRIIELLEIQADEGPCPDAYHTGQPSINKDLEEVNGRWPHFSPAALKSGFRSVHALPMRLRGLTIGALNMFRKHPGGFEQADILAAQAMADVATISILQHQATLEGHILTEQLQHALDSRVIIEQAKGKIAERARLDMDKAFQWMRKHARNQNLLLIDVANGVIQDTIELNPVYIDQ